MTLLRSADRISATTVAVTALAILLGHASPTDAQVRPEVSLGLLVGVPSGDFADNVSATGIGLVLSGGLRVPDSPVVLGAELGYLVYGYETRTEPFNSTTPDVRVEVATSNNIFQGSFFLRMQSAEGKARPYVDGLLGFKYLYTETSVNDDDGWFDRLVDYVNFDDWSFTYGIGVGVTITLWQRQPDPDEGIGPLGVHLDMGARYLLGTEADYLKEGSIQRVGDQVSFTPDRSKTDMLHPHLQVKVSF